MEVERKLSFDEASLERSKSFVNALQELKNLRPQLYSAAEYCEKSYLHSEQKQMVLDNLKEYAMRALVNAVDHLGTVAYKLNDLLEQQTIDVNSVDLKLTSLNQKILTCQTYMDKEGARQQKLMAIVPRHHKRYTLPTSVSKKVHFGPNVSADPGQVHIRARPRTTPSGSPSSKSLSWHLASGSESMPSTKGTHKSSRSFEVQQSSPNPTSVFHLLDNEEDTQAKLSASAKQQQPSNRNPSSSAPVQPFGATYKDTSKGSRPVTQFKSLDKPTRQQQQIITAPPRSKSMISSFFVKQKAVKLKAGTVA